MQFLSLADGAQHIPQIAAWYFHQWGHLGRDTGPGDVAGKLHNFLNRDVLPLMVLGLQNDELAGVVQLKRYEMDIYPDKEHWLGGVYVAPHYRGRGIATRLIERAMDRARGLEIETLHLQTERLDGGLYAQLGWQPLERVRYRGLEVLVMARQLGDRSAPV